MTIDLLFASATLYAPPHTATQPPVEMIKKVPRTARCIFMECGASLFKGQLIVVCQKVPGNAFF